MRSFARYFTVFMVFGLACLPLRAWAGSAGDLVANFQSGLTDVMKKADSLGVKGRYAKLEPVIKNTFHLALMAGISAGPYWHKATNEQRSDLVQAFAGMSVATLATLFSGYSGEEFVVTGERPGPQGITFVDTALKIPSRESDVTISYVARKFEGEWRLIDVIVDGGISELKVRISEYRLTLNQSGIDGLIKLLKVKTSDLLS